MCGICGVAELTRPVTTTEAELRRATDSLAHRGPDDAGTLLGPGFAFGHRRLSIVDLSAAGHQPMVSPDGALTLVYNGEVYNHRELRPGLERAGYVFRTSCDTEVLLHGLHHEGAAFLSRINGMFAFAAHDARTGTTWLGRDRVGIKPLFYSARGGRLAFGSEVKAVLALDPAPRVLNRHAVSSYLSFRYPVLDDTFFEGIMSLPPGHVLTARGGDVSIRCWWDPADRYADQDRPRPEGEDLDQLRGLMRASVGYRLLADVPVGTILSGGVDSSVITALASDLHGTIGTYTIGYDEAGYNEFEYASLTATRYATRHHELRSDPESYLRHLEELIGLKDAPLSIPNEPAQFELCRRLRKDITVVLAGTGADEIFYGYGRIFRSAWDFERMAGIDPVEGEPGAAFRAACRARYGRESFGSELDHFLHVYQYTAPELKRTMLQPRWVAEDSEALLRERLAGLFARVPGGSYLDRMGYAFLKLHLPGILWHNDVTSMGAGVEMRVPFLDHRLVEFALGVPAERKLRFHSEAARERARGLTSEAISETLDTPKHQLRAAFGELVPEAVLARRKVGFPVPLPAWLGGPLRGWARELLLSPRATERGLYEPGTLRAWLDGGAVGEHAGDERTYQQSVAGKVWMLANLELFCRQYFD